MRNEANYDQYEKACAEIREKNEELLDLFEGDLRAAGLKDATISRHVSNVDFFINVYLLTYDALEAEEGCYEVGGFLGDFFIRKCMWSTPASIKQNAASFKKFYKCLLEHGLIARASYDTLLDSIKYDMQDWQDLCAEFNDPTQDNPFNPFAGLPDDLFSDRRSSDDGNSPELAASDGSATQNAGASPSTAAYASLLEDILQQDVADGWKDFDSEELPTKEELTRGLTIMLLRLTSWEERERGQAGRTYRRAWKSANRDALDELQELGFISDTRKAKSVTVTDKGMEYADALLEAFGFGYLLDE